VLTAWRFHAGFRIECEFEPRLFGDEQCVSVE
jgi:hypothetical protein